MKVLLVDDDSYIADSLRDLFEFIGYSCTLAANGSEAMEKMIQFTPDIILTDIMMPEMNGIEFYRKVKKGGYTGQFYFMTGYELPHNQSEIPREADGIFSKPFEFKALFDKIMAKKRHSDNLNACVKIC